MKIIKITERIGNILTTIDVTVDDVARVLSSRLIMFVDIKLHG